MPLPPAAPDVARPLRRSLRGQLLILALSGFVAALAADLAGYVELQRASRAAAETTAVHMAETLSLQVQRVSEGVPGIAPSEAQRLVDFVHERDGRDIEVVQPSLRIVADADHADIGDTLEADNAAQVAATLRDGRPRTYVEPAEGEEGDRQQVVVAITPQGGGPAEGALVLEYTPLLDEMADDNRRVSLRNFLIRLPVGLLLLGLAVRTAGPISRSVLRIRSAALELARGRRDGRIGEYPDNELGDLATAFDQMAEELERRVAERTAALVDINQRLDAQLTERERMERKLEQLARFDPLTGLPNRSLFLQRLEEALARSRRTGKLVGLMFVDLDRFKSINDSLGHEVGDRVLQQVSHRMRSLLRQNDTVSRIGGDEFTVIVEDVDAPSTLGDVARKLVEGVAPPLRVGDNELFMTLSIGIATSEQEAGDGDDIAELMRRADLAMYQAKTEGRNGFRFHSDRLGEAARDRAAMEQALRHALERDEFELHYQVRVSATTHRPMGMEALLRWRSPELGAVAPADFIPVAEETGLIVPLGAWVLATAAAQHVAWRREGLEPGVIGVNVSARQFKQVDFTSTVAEIVAAAGARPQDIELELTESLLMSNPERASTTMTELRSLGFGIAIDDFGTGYSSLSHLKHFPATKIKIDRAFVRSIDTNTDDAAIAAAVVALANTLRLEITAEGVETPGQLAHLDRLSCSEYQGFLFGRPLDPEGMRALLARSPRGANNVDTLGKPTRLTG